MSWLSVFFSHRFLIVSLKRFYLILNFRLFNGEMVGIQRASEQLGHFDDELSPNISVFFTK